MGQKDDDVEVYAVVIYEHHWSKFENAAAAGWVKGDPIESATRHFQMLYHEVNGREYLPRIVKDDPRVLDLLLGLLFHYNPT